jgi:hypothetical protein
MPGHLHTLPFSAQQMEESVVRFPPERKRHFHKLDLLFVSIPLEKLLALWQQSAQRLESAFR